MGGKERARRASHRHNGVAVSRGLQKGDSVIVAGMQKVGTGTAVTTR